MHSGTVLDDMGSSVGLTAPWAVGVFVGRKRGVYDTSQ